MTRVLVAGATGYLGRFVARECKQRGDWVRVLARHPEKLKTPGPFLEPAIAGLVDEVFVGEVTRPETLRGLCEGIEVVFTSIGITRQTDRCSYMDVDYQGNRNLLDCAVESSVRRFVFVHLYNAHRLLHLESIQAKQRFVEVLRQSGLANTIICPTGYFNDMSEFLKMARKGRVFQIGDGASRINPIHGADLAKVCVDAMTSGPADIPVGGPLTFSYREIAELAFSLLGRPPQIHRVPVWLAKALVSALRPFSKKYHDMAAGIVTISQEDFLAPACGTHSLGSFYEELVAAT